MPTHTPNITPQHTIDEELVALLVTEHERHTLPALRRLWDYYRNDLDFADGDAHRPYRAAQEQGLPDRLSRTPGTPRRAVDGKHREVVIENDIAWRLHTLVDFMFGRPVAIESKATDPQRARLIERVIHTVFEANGGVCFFQDLALLGGVYGFADVLLRDDTLTFHRASMSDTPAAGTNAERAPSKHPDPERILRAASQLVLETVEAPRAVPVLDPSDYRRLIGYVLHYTQTLNRVDHTSFLSRLVDASGRARRRQATRDVTEVWTAESVHVYHDGEMVERRTNRLGRLPVVHIQNLPQPLFYEGLSEVEPLIPLQDELNTRLSDRANRVTLQSFKMYLGKGIDNFLERPVGPGQMWMTDNPDATIEQFGGDGPNPSEDTHINEVREAIDKTSGVTAVAAGLLRNKVGNLTSENALRIVMMGLLAKTEKKRVTYGKGVERLVELMLHALHVAGVLETEEQEREVRLHWPSPLPENESQRLRDAELKLKIGVPQERVLAELGYSDCA